MFAAWKEFKQGKNQKSDVLRFEFNLENNIFNLHQELKSKTYQHFKYTAFSIIDPKLRKIHKANVKDRVLHHAIFRIFYPIFDKSFIFDSYSSRIGKGTHRAISRLRIFLIKESKNNRKNAFVLKLDIKKFFDSVNKGILINLIKNKINDSDAIWLAERIVKSFNESEENGIPLGNVTSQLFANIYLNELDQFIKHKLKIKYYLRYCDDFIIIDENEESLKNLIKPIDNFLEDKLKLNLHPNKIILRKYNQGIDFLGYVIFPNHIILRTKTKRRIFGKIKTGKKELELGLIDKKSFDQRLQSYFGMLRHCKGKKIRNEMNKILEN